MEHGPEPYCEDCLVPLTVKHFLAECPSSSDAWLRYYPECANLDTDATLKIIPAEQPNIVYNSNKLMDYLREIEMVAVIV